VIPPYYDSLIAKVICWDTGRDRAIARTLRALSEFEIDGVPTTRDFACGILRSPEFTSGEYSTSFLEERLVTV
jgi:acetyl-CoA carboxylase biotin carboxylase subunit